MVSTVISFIMKSLGKKESIRWRYRNFIFNFKRQHLGNHTFGISTQNILLKGDVKYAGAAVLSYAGELFKKHLDIELYIIAKDLISHSDDFIFGKEKNEFDVSFKAGTWVFNFLKFYGQIGSDYAGGSAGIHAPTLNKGRDLTLMYQFLFPFRTEFPSHSIFMRSEFGDSRKLKMDKKITEKMDVIPYDLYNKAMKLFSEGQYWEAYFIFSRIVTEYPKFLRTILSAFTVAFALKDSISEKRQCRNINDQ